MPWSTSRRYAAATSTGATSSNARSLIILIGQRVPVYQPRCPPQPDQVSAPRQWRPQPCHHTHPHPQSSVRPAKPPSNGPTSGAKGPKGPDATSITAEPYLLHPVRRFALRPPSPPSTTASAPPGPRPRRPAASPSPPSPPSQPNAAAPSRAPCVSASAPLTPPTAAGRPSAAPTSSSLPFSSWSTSSRNTRAKLFRASSRSLSSPRPTAPSSPAWATTSSTRPRVATASAQTPFSSASISTAPSTPWPCGTTCPPSLSAPAGTCGIRFCFQSPTTCITSKKWSGPMQRPPSPKIRPAPPFRARLSTGAQRRLPVAIQQGAKQIRRAKQTGRTPHRRPRLRVRESLELGKIPLLQEYPTTVDDG